ncbi:MAG: Gfo/Idh/MocA family oxidoreductase, partial [Gemmatimonadota bacterium]
MAPVRLGFIGLGHITVHAHLPALEPLVEAGEVLLSAFCDIDEKTVKQQAQAFGARSTYTDYHAMFDREKLDAVYVCLPPTLHTDQVPLAAARGLHLFVEKPQSLDMAQAVEHGAAIEKAGVVSQVGFQSRYYPTAEFARQRLSELTPRHAQVQLFYSGKPVRWWTSRYEECGGSFVENTIHMVDLLRYLLGDIERVSAFYYWRQPGEG